MTKRQPQRKVAGMNVGSASLVMVFAILCLTIFAVLSVVTARNEWTLAKKTSDAVTAYYAADSLAVEIMDTLIADDDRSFTDLLPLIDSIATIEPMDELGNLNYYVPIDARQSLWVQLHDTNETLHVARWEVIENDTWIVDDTINVWDGF